MLFLSIAFASADEKEKSLMSVLDLITCLAQFHVILALYTIYILNIWS